MDRRGFLQALGVSIFAPQFGSWFARPSGVLARAPFVSMSGTSMAPFPGQWSGTVLEPGYVTVADLERFQKLILERGRMLWTPMPEVVSISEWNQRKAALRSAERAIERAVERHVMVFQ